MIILDLDGTIADDKWRHKFINLKMKDPMMRDHDYNLVVGFDELCNEHLFLDKEIIIITERPVFYKAITFEWLQRKGIKTKFIVFRPNGNTLPDHELKNIQLTSLMLQHSIKVEDIECAYDDNHAVIKMYEKFGIQAIAVLNRRKDEVSEVSK